MSPFKDSEYTEEMRRKDELELKMAQISLLLPPDVSKLPEWAKAPYTGVIR